MKILGFIILGLLLLVTIPFLIWYLFRIASGACLRSWAEYKKKEQSDGQEKEKA